MKTAEDIAKEIVTNVIEEQLINNHTIEESILNATTELTTWKEDICKKQTKAIKKAIKDLETVDGIGLDQIVIDLQQLIEPT